MEINGSDCCLCKNHQHHDKIAINHNNNNNNINNNNDAKDCGLEIKYELDNNKNIESLNINQIEIKLGEIEAKIQENLTINDINECKSVQDESLFDSNIFEKIDLSEFKFKYDLFELKQEADNEYVYDLGDNLVLRPLKQNDYEREYMKLLEQLTIVGDDVTREKFESRFRQMKLCSQTYYICVIHDRNLNKIVGSCTLVNEQKFIRHAGSRGRVEDVVVDNTYRGKKLGKLLLDFIMSLSKCIGNYKTSLECRDHLRNFYGSFGFSLESGQNYLCKRFDEIKLPKL